MKKINIILLVSLGIIIAFAILGFKGTFFTIEPITIGNCVDSDGGKNYYIKGENTDPDFPVNPAIDYCIDNEVLREYTCNSATGNRTSENVNCTELAVGSVCQMGACIIPSGTNCTDSDGGSDFYTKGQTIDLNARLTVANDYCITTNKLREYYCKADNDSRWWQETDCNCSMGACEALPEPEPIPPVCTEDWNCIEWSACTDNVQTRTCIDFNNCGTTLNKPSELQGCAVIECKFWEKDIDGQCQNDTVKIAILLGLAYFLFFRKKRK